MYIYLVYVTLLILDGNETIIRNELISQVEPHKQIGINDVEEFPPMVVMRMNWASKMRVRFESGRFSLGFLNKNSLKHILGHLWVNENLTRWHTCFMYRMKKKYLNVKIKQLIRKTGMSLFSYFVICFVKKKRSL